MAFVAGRSTESLDGMQSQLRQFFIAPSIWHRFARVVAIFSVVGAALWAFDPEPYNFYIWSSCAVFFFAVGALPSTRGVILVYLALFAIWAGTIVWWLGIRNAV
jgi:hypothetical protein